MTRARQSVSTQASISCMAAALIANVPTSDGTAGRAVLTDADFATTVGE